MEASSSPSGFLPQQRVVSMQFRNWKARRMSQSQGPPKVHRANGGGWRDLPPTPFLLLALTASTPLPSLAPWRELSAYGPAPEMPGTKPKGALLLMVSHEALCVPRALCKLSYIALEFGILPSPGMKTLKPREGK